MNNLNWTMGRNSSKYVLDHNAVDKCLQQIAIYIRREGLLPQLVMDDFPLYYYNIYYDLLLLLLQLGLVLLVIILIHIVIIIHKNNNNNNKSGQIAFLRILQ